LKDYIGLGKARADQAVGRIRGRREWRGTADSAAARTFVELYQQTDDAATVSWLGRPIWQYPSDAWLIQEVVCRLKPDLIIETGTHRGGSALFLGNVLDALGHGHVVSIDTAALETPEHARITYFTGSSTDETILERVRDEVERRGSNVFVILDSDHSRAHVAAELDVYAEMVQVGGYVHVQDGWAVSDGRRVMYGPAFAVKDFLSRCSDFVRDEDVERRFVVTAHPYGWLRRVS
jgi:cephalosporin hydroxylase